MDDLGVLLDAINIALDQLMHSKRLTLAQALRLTAHLRNAQVPVSDLFPLDPGRLEMAEIAVAFLGEVNRLLARYRPLMAGEVRMAEAPLLQASIEGAWREARDGRMYMLR